MNTATWLPTFRCDRELGAVVIAFSRATRQTLERLNAYSPEQRNAEPNLIVETNFPLFQVLFFY